MSLRITTIVVGLLLGLSCGCASSGAEDLPSTADLPRQSPWSDFTLGPNDIVRVTVFGHPEASTRAEGVRITPDGAVSLPYLGAVQVGGSTPDDARAAIQDSFSAIYRDPKVSVSVLDHRSRNFYVLGHVDRPGAYPLDRPMNALQALSLGGKFLRGAKRAHVLLLRRVEEEYEVYRLDGLDPGNDGLAAVLPDDVLYVPRSFHGRFWEEILPYLQGAGFAAAVPVGIQSLED